MDARPELLGEIFSVKRSYRIPLYQRPYIWEKENWEHLWRDIEEKAILRYKGDPKSHFTGAIVVQTNDVHRSQYEIIDGQQRLTTFQIILSVIRYIAKNHSDATRDIRSLYNTINGYLEINNNSGDPEESFRLLPVANTTDKRAIQDIVTGSMQSDKLKPPHRMYEAYRYYKNQVMSYIDCDVNENYNKLFSLHDTIIQDFKVVRIILDDTKDEAEKIFESINGRGRALRDFDHLRNNLFLRAGPGERRNRFYNIYWRHFDTDEYWNSEQNGQRFLEGFLKAKLIKEYQAIQDKNSPNRRAIDVFDTYQTKFRPTLKDNIEQEFQELKKYSDTWCYLHGNPIRDEWIQIREFSKLFHIDSWIPLILRIYNETNIKENPGELNLFFRTIESYTIRRAMCFGAHRMGFTNNTPPQSLLSEMDKWQERFHVVDFVKILGALNRDFWPDDQRIARSFNNTKGKASADSDNRMLRYVLYRIELLKQQQDRTADVNINPEQFTLEHIMPRNWEMYWGLPQSESGELLEYGSIFRSDYKREHPNWIENPSEDGLIDDDAGIFRDALELAMTRKAAIDSIGNLTIMKPKSNNRLGNSQFEKKKQVYADSKLYLNREIATKHVWDVEQIREREKELLEIFQKNWPTWENLIEQTGIAVDYKTASDRKIQSWGNVCFATYEDVVCLTDVEMHRYEAEGKSVAGSRVLRSKDTILFAFENSGHCDTQSACADLIYDVREDVKTKGLREGMRNRMKGNKLLNLHSIVFLTLRTGDMLKGRIVRRDEYEIQLEVDGGRFVVVYKHALYEVKNNTRRDGIIVAAGKKCRVSVPKNIRNARHVGVRTLSRGVDRSKLKKGQSVNYLIVRTEEGFIADDVTLS